MDRSYFGHTVSPCSFERLSANPGVFVQARAKRLRLCGELISPFDAPERGVISAAEECWLHAAIEVLLEAKQKGILPPSAWIYASGEIVPAQFDPSWLALRSRSLLSVRVARGYQVTDVGAWLSAFPDEASCLRHIERVMWPSGPTCWRCSGQRVQRSPRAWPRRWWCADCRAEFTVLQETPIGSSHWPLKAWFASAFLFACDRNALTISAVKAATGCEKQAVWSMLRRGGASRLSNREWRDLVDVIVFGEQPSTDLPVTSPKAEPPFVLVEPTAPPELPGLGKQHRSPEELARTRELRRERRATKLAAGVRINLGGRPRQQAVAATAPPAA